ncbi:MAG TPA: efflux RND transporter periplasmic adaptor subunit [Roseimicrobium sp.]|nr:efflux RND transporter periplasmic adaptor subunit [Roseimicrobium sp.]
MKHSLRNGGLACAFLLALAGNRLVAADSSPAVPDWKYARPARGEITRFVSLPGTLRADQQTTLYAKVAGYIEKINVDRGDRVKMGAMLAEISAPELEADARRNEAEIQKWIAETDVSTIELKRLTGARSKSPDLVIPQAVDAAEARLRKATAEIAIAKAGLERLNTLLAFRKIKAPFDGVVTARMVDVGAFIPAATSGSAAQSAALFTVMDLNKVRVQVAVPEVEAALVKEGQPVKVSVEGLPGAVREGRVSRFSYALEESTRTMMTEAELSNADWQLRPGMYAIVKIGLEKHIDALIVPTDAVVMEKTAAFVYLYVDGKAKKMSVKLGFQDGPKSEIASGIDAGAQVLLVGKRPIVNDQAVKAVEAQ